MDNLDIIFLFEKSNVIVHVCKHKIITTGELLSEMSQEEFQEHSDLDKNTQFKIINLILLMLFKCLLL